MTTADTFYAQLEPDIREIVRALRNAGINTECSCGHEMYVQCQTTDPTLELNIIYTVLNELDIKDFDIILTARVYEGHWYKGLVIRL